MKKVQKSWMVWVACLCGALSWQCSGGKQTKKDNPDATKGVTTIKQRGCIRGRVVNEDGKGFAGVLVSTDPPTSPEVTDSRGFFEICNRRVIKNEETGETAKEALVDSSYTLKLNKDGYHSRPLKFEYAGTNIKLRNLVMVEKTRPLPTVVETKTKETKRDTGIEPKAPISE
ncbi:MAG: carboxypeptidase regulatory-like domain-containing protein [Myxococcales bacterium]|nr:carboxypeptidase regulatory-like domain-containing protein [Myxococcales bacterium]